ncbi:Bifunctional lycopene cyclase/phytoene synthase [Choanephora cucurbitarum]|uniref:15-cis-phytoene synthase n=2 Tax=Choanephora cucurbitarum TaxID=101091 RepID=A0A1C7N4M7_9FUNG|nr:Bifunctional lycopene cyclase/phytoene synthase [Choanephora cucurbitarum]
MSYIYYTAAALLVVLSIYKPFISKLDKARSIGLGVASFLAPFIIKYNSLLESNIAFKFSKQWLYSTNLVHSSSSSNETTFDTMQHLTYLNDNVSLMTDAIVLFILAFITASLHGLFTRWQFSITFVRPRANAYFSMFLRYGLSTLNLCLAVMSQKASSHKLSLAFSFFGLLWYLSGPYLIRRWKPAVAVALISAGFSFFVCNTASADSLLYKISFLDWALYTTVLVLVCHSLDHLDALMNTYPYLVEADKEKQCHFQDATSFSYWSHMFYLACNIPSEHELDPAPIENLETAIKVLGPASRSWKTMAALFPVNLRQDLCLLYAFFRTADDLVDDAPTPEQCSENLVTIRRFLRDVFSPAKASDNPTLDTLPSHINWDQYAELLPNEEVLVIFKNFARIAHYLCSRAMFELTDAWELDLLGKPVKKQNDLLDYAALISGTFGELCTCAIMYKTGHGNWGKQLDNAARDEDVLSRARATGQCLQLVNIARDIIADSLVGRCYVPVQYMASKDTYRLLKEAKAPYQVGEHTLKSYSLRILELADQISDKAQKGIDGLPEEVQDSIRAAFEIYMAIGPILRNDSGFPLRAKVPKGQQQWIALRCIYGFRGPVARAITRTFYEMVSLYSRETTNTH